VKLSVKHADGSTLELQVNHTMNEGQITWFSSDVGKQEGKCLLPFFFFSFFFLYVEHFVKAWGFQVGLKSVCGNTLAACESTRDTLQQT